MQPNLNEYNLAISNSGLKDLKDKDEEVLKNLHEINTAWKGTLPYMNTASESQQKALELR